MARNMVDALERMVYSNIGYSSLIPLSIMSVGVGFVLLGICYLLSETKETKLTLEKCVGYECGFDPFCDAREEFHIKFYLISILFILFDIELIYFLPWLLCQKLVLFTSFGWLGVFFFFLLLGYGYEVQTKKLKYRQAVPTKWYMSAILWAGCAFFFLLFYVVFYSLLRALS